MAVLALALAACAPINPTSSPLDTPSPAPTLTLPPAVTPLPTRPAYLPGQLVEYTVQTGDSLPALAVRFNTSIQEIRTANPIIPEHVTTLPPGMPMQIPIYYLPLWGTPYQIIPDQLFINGPAQVGFDTQAFIDSQPGWLKNYSEYASGSNLRAGQIVDLVALNYSVSPRLLLALLDYQAGALSQPQPPDGLAPYYLGKRYYANRGLYLQLGWAANALNNVYYPWRDGQMASFDHPDGRIERPDPWQNAATVALQVYFSKLLDREAYTAAVSGQGLAAVYARLFGDPWTAIQPHIPGSLEQPSLRLPFEPGTTWAFTGGPHTGWGEGAPLAALDFAPPSVAGGCTPTDEWTTAVADGIIVRSEPGLAVLDLDGDNDERTGWTIFYLHLGDEGRIAQGTVVKAGAPVGHPSCEAGRATGTHVHIARKYNGEWISAASVLTFNLEGWLAYEGSAPYEGTLVRFDHTVTACACSSRDTFIQSSPK